MSLETREEVSTPIEEHISLNISVSVPVPVYHYMTIQEKIELYTNQLSSIEKMALVIAEEHLGTSFNLQKSNGFIEWCKNLDK
jgi:hypothetical protein